MELFRKYGKWVAVYRFENKVYFTSDVNFGQAVKDLEKNVELELWVHKDNSVAIMAQP